MTHAVGSGRCARTNHRPALLVVNAEVEGVADLAVRCRGGKVVEVGRGLAAAASEHALDARGGALLPGLHDHHIHLFALAGARRSVRCGPPGVTTVGELATALEDAPGDDWIRGVGYHESVAGMLDRQALDRLRGDRPIRIQHCSGKIWFVNSLAAKRLGIESRNGRLFRLDGLLRERLAEDDGFVPAVEETSRLLAGYGITGITDATYTNDASTEALYRRLDLCQRVNLMGNESLTAGSLKIMLDDAELPDIDSLQDRIACAHVRGRPVAFHCVTRTELVFALAALREAGAMPGDRIEHAAVTDRSTLQLLRRVSGADRRITVVTQPNFIAERGDRYLLDIRPEHYNILYRCRGFLEAGIPLGGGTDAPYGSPDPWAAMRAAIERRTPDGQILGEDETLTPTAALGLFLAPLATPGAAARRVAVGAPANFCILDRRWQEAADSLCAELVSATVHEDGSIRRR